MKILYPTVDHVQAFDEAWNAPRFTRFELPPVDVNRLIAERYDVAVPISLTRDQLWQMETRKARRPDRYIPYVVKAGSADAWADATPSPGVDTFVRKSEQRLWMHPDRYGLVLEQTRLDHETQTVTFIGARDYPARDGRTLHAGTDQPIFHVVHGVGGEPDRPLDRWLVVLETERQDSRLLQPFLALANDPWLPGYVERFVRQDLGIGLERRH